MASGRRFWSISMTGFFAELPGVDADARFITVLAFFNILFSVAESWGKTALLTLGSWLAAAKGCRVNAMTEVSLAANFARIWRPTNPFAPMTRTESRKIHFSKSLW